MPYTKLRHELNRLTSGIWEDVTLVRGAISPWKLGEVTVTERLHLDLLRSGHLSGLVLYDVPNEKKTGADWEWCIQVPGTQSYLRYRIQAKILDPRSAKKAKQSLRFEHLDHPNGTGRQRSTLLAAAMADRAVPYYAFYVGDPWPSDEAVTLPPDWAKSLGVPVEHFGCTAVPADVVDHVRANARRPKLAANKYVAKANGRASRRLSDLFPGSSVAGGPSGPNLDRATELSQDERVLLERFRAQAASGGSRVVVEDLPAKEREREDAPLRMTAYFTA